MSKLVLGFFAIVISSNALAQYDQYGLIYPTEANTESFCCALFPQKGELKLYDAPDGDAAGIITHVLKKKWYGDEYELVFINNQNDTAKIEYPDNLKEVGYENAAFRFTARQDDYVKVLNGIGEYWVNTDDLHTLQFAALSYQEYMVRLSKKDTKFHPEDKLNLRASDSATADKIETLGVLHRMTFTGEHNGAWSKVKVIKLKEEPCETGNTIIEYELEGWIKVIDDKGVLNVWYPTRGC